mmetsp:Transcript_34021/g.44927  ORF Transcript_34021/g.44927 Transcript_34021/m.44927 type:complete len:201 (-) Transcript_34021:163-765(-)
MSSRGKHFVPVTDVEKARCEQDFYSDNLRKHRKFDNPFDDNLRGGKPKKKVDRGWGEHGSVGWGVRGFHGSAQKDTGGGKSTVNVCKNKRFKMVQDQHGRWVKQKIEDSGGDDGETQPGSVLQYKTKRKSSSQERNRRRSRTRSRSRDKRRSRKRDSRRRSRSREKGGRQHDRRDSRRDKKYEETNVPKQKKWDPEWGWT